MIRTLALFLVGLGIGALGAASLVVVHSPGDDPLTVHSLQTQLAAAQGLIHQLTAMVQDQEDTIDALQHKEDADAQAAPPLGEHVDR